MIEPSWIKVSYETIPKMFWRAEIEHKIKMANAPHGYVSGTMYVPPHIHEAIIIWHENRQFKQTLTLDRFIIKMFGTKDLSKKRKHRRKK